MTTLFDDRLVVQPRHAGAGASAAVALHAAGAALLVMFPLYVPLELPEVPPVRALTFHRPAAPVIVHAATRTVNAPALRASGTRSGSNKPASPPVAMTVPSQVPDTLPAPDLSMLAGFDASLPFGAGCVGPSCAAGSGDSLDEAAGTGSGSSDGSGSAGARVAGRDVSPPLKLYDVRPTYPELARRARVRGSVVIVCTIAPDGRVADARVTAGPPLLSDAALDAVRQWRYRPTLLGGTPVAVVLTVTVTFHLDP